LRIYPCVTAEANVCMCSVRSAVEAVNPLPRCMHYFHQLFTCHLFATQLLLVHLLHLCHGDAKGHIQHSIYNKIRFAIRYYIQAIMVGAREPIIKGERHASNIIFC